MKGPGLSFRIIHTRRLVIRPLEAKDYEVWRAYHVDRPARKNQYERKALLPKEATRAVFKKHLARERRLVTDDLQYNLGLFETKTGAMIGRIDFLIYSRLIIQAANLGYAIHNHHWGKGYATEAVRAALPEAFRRLKLHRIEASTEPANLGSIAVMKKSGLKPEGLRRSYLYYDGKWRSLLFYSAVSQEWGVRATKPTVRVRVGN